MHAKRSKPSLRSQLEEAQKEIARQSEELEDLRVLYETTLEHSEAIDELLAEKNAMLERLSLQLSKYLSPQVYRSIFTGQQEGGISARRKKLTIFFSDIVGFTEITDSLESEELTALINRYLTEMSRIALDYGATIDKYIGDAIMAFFGDPESKGVREDALACVEMAIAMQRRMRELQSEWIDLGVENPFRLRIGINTGFCTVGNFGSADRMDYTVIGSEVNLASRLQAHADVDGILLSHQTYSLVSDRVHAEELKPITVKGFLKPVHTYRVLDIFPTTSSSDAIVRHDFDGLRIDGDLERLSPEAHAAAMQAVKGLLVRLRARRPAGERASERDAPTSDDEDGS